VVGAAKIAVLKMKIVNVNLVLTNGKASFAKTLLLLGRSVLLLFIVIVVVIFASRHVGNPSIGTHVGVGGVSGWKRHIVAAVVELRSYSLSLLHE